MLGPRDGAAEKIFMRDASLLEPTSQTRDWASGLREVEAYLTEVNEMLGGEAESLPDAGRAHPAASLVEATLRRVKRLRLEVRNAVRQEELEVMKDYLHSIGRPKLLQSALAELRATVASLEQQQSLDEPGADELWVCRQALKYVQERQEADPGLRQEPP